MDCLEFFYLYPCSPEGESQFIWWAIADLYGLKQMDSVPPGSLHVMFETLNMFCPMNRLFFRQFFEFPKAFTHHISNEDRDKSKQVKNIIYVLNNLVCPRKDVMKI